MKIEANFTLDAGDAQVDVNEWEEIIQLKPTECGQKGDASKRGKGHIISNSYWTLASSRKSDVSVDETVSSLLEVIVLKSTNVNNLIEKYGLDCGVAIFVWLEDEDDISDVDVHLSNRTIRMLSEVHADFSVRIYE